MEKNSNRSESKGGGLGAMLIAGVLAAGLAAAGNDDKEPRNTDHAAEIANVQDQKKGKPAWQTTLALEKLADKSRGTEQRAYVGVQHFREHGYTEEQAVGIICNFMGEGSKLDPSQRQYGGGPGIGIAQWEGGRKQDLYAHAKDKRAPWNDYDLQLDFVIKELNGKEERADAHIRETDTVWGAIAAAVRSYERPRDQSDGQVQRRYEVCQPILGELATVMELDLA